MQHDQSYDPQALTAALSRLERPLSQGAMMIASECQLFRGLLVVDDARLVFLCRRFGPWEVLVDVAGPAAREARARRSFTSDRFEIRAAVDGHLVRFSDLGEEEATALTLLLRGERASAQRLMRAGGASTGTPARPASTRASSRRPPPPPPPRSPKVLSGAIEVDVA